MVRMNHDDGEDDAQTIFKFLYFSDIISIKLHHTLRAMSFIYLFL